MEQISKTPSYSTEFQLVYNIFNDYLGKLIQNIKEHPKSQQYLSEQCFTLLQTLSNDVISRIKFLTIHNLLFSIEQMNLFEFDNKTYLFLKLILSFKLDFRGNESKIKVDDISYISDTIYRCLRSMNVGFKSEEEFQNLLEIMTKIKTFRGNQAYKEETEKVKQSKKESSELLKNKCNKPQCNNPCIGPSFRQNGARWYNHQCDDHYRKGKQLIAKKIRKKSKG